MPSRLDRPRLRSLPGGDASPAPEPTDEEILAGLLGHERWAAGALYDQCHTIVERTLLRILRQRDADFDDLIQGVFERLLRTVARQRFAGAVSLKAWASSTAMHVALDELRRRKRNRRLVSSDELEPHDLGPHGPSLDKHLEARSEVGRLQSIVARLRPEQAHALLLHDVLGHDLPEIAALTGTSVAAAQSRVLRGRRELLRRASASTGRTP